MAFNPDSITKDHIEKAFREIEETQPELESSTKYDVVFNGKRYPPKAVMRIAHRIANGEEIWGLRGGDPTNKYFRKFGYEIKPKNDSQSFGLTVQKFEQLFQQYYEYCKRSVRLTYREAYKFRFGRWIFERVDFENHSDDEILQLCISSQEQKYLEDEKGINFIRSALQYNDSFISLSDVTALRKLHLDEELSDNDLKGSSMSFPKLSCWAGSIFPERYRILANEELISSIAHLYNLNSYPKSGVKGFEFANSYLFEISSEIDRRFPDQQKELVMLIFGKDSEVLEVDKSWLAQDFMLYLNRRVLRQQPHHYWVNQGTSFPSEREKRIVFASQKNLSYHKRLKELAEGDVILHYSKKEIVATSVVKREFVNVIEGHSFYKGENGLLVEVDYDTLSSPIPLSYIQNILKERPNLIPKNHSPVNKDLGINKGYLYKISKDLFDALVGSVNNEEIQLTTNKINTMMPNLNTILYGPPGTGKTYHTIDKSVQIADPQHYDPENHAQNKKRFDELVKDGRIVFTTFHQSLSYEDFIEGLKPIEPVNEDSAVIYRVEDGILNRFVRMLKHLKEAIVLKHLSIHS